MDALKSFSEFVQLSESYSDEYFKQNSKRKGKAILNKDGSEKSNSILLDDKGIMFAMKTDKNTIYIDNADTLDGGGEFPLKIFDNVKKIKKANSPLKLDDRDIWVGGVDDKGNVYIKDTDTNDTYIELTVDCFNTLKKLKV